MSIDCVVQIMVERKIPLTQRGYLTLAYFGDKQRLEELEAEERCMLPEGFEYWPVDEGQVN